MLWGLAVVYIKGQLPTWQGFDCCLTAICHPIVWHLAVSDALWVACSLGLAWLMKPRCHDRLMTQSASIPTGGLSREAAFTSLLSFNFQTAGFVLHTWNLGRTLLEQNQEHQLQIAPESSPLTEMAKCAGGEFPPAHISGRRCPGSC